MYRRRLRFEWRAAVVVALTAAVAALAGQLPAPINSGWVLLAGLVLVLGVGVVVLGVIYRGPALPPVTPLPAPFREGQLTAAAAHARRGRPVDPPELAPAAVDNTRRGLRLIHLQLAWMPMLGASWTLRIGESGLDTVFGFIGVAVIVANLGGLVWSRRVQHRLDTLEPDRLAVSG